jgi:hypothetical protein
MINETVKMNGQVYSCREFAYKISEHFLCQLLRNESQVSQVTAGWCKKVDQPLLGGKNVQRDSPVDLFRELIVEIKVTYLLVGCL